MATVRPKAVMVWLCPLEWHGGLIDLDLDACPTGPLCVVKGCQSGRTATLEEMTKAFDDLVYEIVRNIHWYQGGAEDALRAVLKEREKLLLLMGEDK